MVAKLKDWFPNFLLTAYKNRIRHWALQMLIFPLIISPVTIITIFYLRGEIARVPTIFLSIALLVNEIVAATVVVHLTHTFIDKHKLQDIKIRDEALFQALTNGVIMFDAQKQVILANPAATRFTGLPQEGYYLSELYKLFPSLDLEKKLDEAIKMDKIIHVEEVSLVDFFFEIFIVSVKGHQGEITGGAIVLHDITQMKKLDQAKTEFVSLASHELRTPLTAIDGLVSMILDGEYGEINKELRQPLSDVNTSSERLIHLVNDLLNLSRLQAGKLKYTLSEIDIKPIVEGVVKMLQVIAEPKGLKLSAPNIDSVTVLVDVNKMEQILDNLIGNSLKFTDKGSIVLSTKITENYVIIFITDTGIGIGKEDVGKLFERFEKLESGLGRAAGTGLGLHISREMARKMGGDVWLEKSEKGVGSTFALSLPKSKTPLAEKVKTDIGIEARVIPDQKAS